MIIKNNMLWAKKLLYRCRPCMSYKSLQSYGGKRHSKTIDRNYSLPFLPWVCLLPICSTYPKHSKHEVLHCHIEKPSGLYKKASFFGDIKIYAPVKDLFYFYVKHIATICITQTMGLPIWGYRQCTYPPSPTFPSQLDLTKLS